MQHEHIQKTEPASEPVRTHEDVLSLIADVERQVARLRDVQALSVDEINRQSAQLQEIEAREHALRGTEAQLRGMAEALRAQDAEIAARAQELQQKEEACARHAEALERDRAGVQDERQRLTAEFARLQDEMRTLEAAREDLARRESALQLEAIRHREALDAMRLQVEAAELARASAQSRQEELTAEAETLAAKVSELEALAETKAREARDLANELRRAQESEAAHVATIESRLAERTSELEATRQNLQLAGQKLAALAQSVADHAPQLERGAAALALVQDQDRRIRELTQQLERTNGATDRVAMLESNLEDALRKKDVLEATVASLERDLGAARQAAEAAACNAETKAADAAQVAEVERLQAVVAEKSKRLAEAALFLKTRKARLDRARELTRARVRRDDRKARESSEAALVRTLEEERFIKRQREELRQVQEMLALSEQRLLRRQARSRGLMAAAWCMLSTCAVGFTCWIAADVLWPLPSVASVDFVAKLESGTTMRPELDTEWQAAHRAALQDSAFRTTVQRRLQERGVVGFSDSAALNVWFDDVRIDSDGPGSFRLIARGADPESATIALDTLATSLVNDSSKLLRGKPELPRAVITGNTAVPGRVTFSTLVPQTSLKDRVAAAAMLFAGVAGLGLAAGLVVFGRLSRAKRKFEDMDAI